MILAIYYGTEMSLHCLDKALEAKYTMFITHFVFYPLFLWPDKTLKANHAHTHIHTHSSLLLISGLFPSLKDKTFVLCWCKLNKETSINHCRKQLYLVTPTLCFHFMTFNLTRGWRKQGRQKTSIHLNSDTHFKLLRLSQREEKRMRKLELKSEANKLQSFPGFNLSRLCKPPLLQLTVSKLRIPSIWCSI